MLNIVVARQGETLQWIDDLPDHCAVTVCTDDASIGVPLEVTRHIGLVRLPGQHSTGGLYLSHLRRAAARPAESTTVFCPGDPLAVCPDFFALLDTSAQWGEVQPLSQSSANGESAHVPRDWLAERPIAPVRFDLRSWAPLGSFDKTMYQAQQRYRQTHQLTDHSHPAAHFFEACGLDAFARTVGGHDLGVRDSGLLFAVRQSRINDWLATCGPALPRVSDWLRQDPAHSRIWDQFWLHLFGLPFVRLDVLSRPDLAVDTGNDEDALLKDFSLGRALATIDDTLARLAPPALTNRDHRPSALQVARAIAAAQSRRGPAQSAAPRQDLADLSQQAAQAFRTGDWQHAVSCAQLALNQDTNHTASRFTLAMALSAQGRREEALVQFEQLLNTEAPASRHAPVADRTTAPTLPQ